VINDEDDNYKAASEGGKTLGQLISDIKANLRMTHGLLYSLIYVLLITLTVYPGLAIHTNFKFMDGVPNATNWTVIGIQLVFNIL